MTRSAEIRKALLVSIGASAGPKVAEVARQYGITKESIYQHLRNLVREGMVTVTGKGRGPVCSPIVAQKYAEFDLNTPLEEHVIWDKVAAPCLDTLPPECLKICQYGFTEIVNNAIDHSDGKKLRVHVMVNPVCLTFMVLDDGVGIFNKIAKALGLPFPGQSILELSKGKLTTDPARHTGEGIFFSSRAFDVFIIQSYGLHFFHSDLTEDWLIEHDAEPTQGTVVFMSLGIPTEKTLTGVFDQYSSGPDEHRFAKTHVPLRLARVGEDNLVSRSQARRVLARFERFEEVLLDFTGVESIGQAFADEIFRVYQHQHRDVKINAMRANEEVQKMITRARSRGSE